MARRLLRIGLWSLAGLVALVVVVVGIVALTFDPDSLKPRIIAAVKQSTGRDLTLQGRMRIGLSLQPTLTVQGVSFANPPGFSRPEMATLQELDVKLALLPLLSHRVEISRLVLIKPDIILETDAQGRPNWQFMPQPAQAPSASTGANGGGTPTRMSLSELQVKDGRLTWRDGRVGSSAVLGLNRLVASAPSPDANLHVSMAATYDDVPLTVEGDVGPLTQLEAARAGAAYPVQLKAQAAGATLTLNGTIDEAQQARGYHVKLSATVPHLAALARFAPNATLPALDDVSLAAELSGAGTALPEISNLTLHAGQSDLAATLPGLRLDELAVAGAGGNQPLKVSARGSFNNAPASLAGSVGSLAALVRGHNGTGPIPLDLELQALGSSLKINGTASRTQGGIPSLAAEVTADKIDLDALASVQGRLSVPAASAAPPTAPAAPATPPAKPAATGRIIPETPISFDVLHRADADVQLRIGQLVWRGATYRTVATHLVLHGGVLRLDPLSAELPEGRLDGMATADASKPAPVVGVKLHIPNLSAQALLAALGEPAFLSGSLNVQANLTGTGATPHAIAASLGGSLSLSMGNGSLDNRLFGSTLGAIVREANLLDLVGRGGTSDIRCLVVQLEAAGGVATLRSLALASSLLTMDGTGVINLGTETLDLHIRPQARIGGTPIVVPLRISGSLRSPITSSDTAATVTQNAGTVAGALLGRTNPLGAIAGALEGQQLLGGGSPAGCATSQPAPARTVPVPNVGGVLKQLFR